MKYKLDVKVSVEIDIIEAFDYYENIETGLGSRFLDYWEVLIETIIQNPLLFQKQYKEFRQALIKPYPYHIIYEINGSTIVIYRVIYAGRSSRKRYNKK